MSGSKAVIDFGTNTARLLIADQIRGGGFRHIHLQREVVRMGGGFSRTEGLSMDAMQRGLACLNRFSESIRAHGIHHVLAVATSAVRDAVNGAAFVHLVRQETGIELRIIDGVVEGTLTLAGVKTGLDCQYDTILVLDIGGGSTEFTLARSGQAVFVHSLPLGVVRLTEGKDSIAAMEIKIRKELANMLLTMRQSGDYVVQGMPLVGTAGTATTLAAISMEMVDYDYRKVNNATVSRQEITSILNRLLPLTLEERLKVPGLEKGREDLIIAGILIILQTMELFGMERMKVSDFGLLEGLLVCGESVVASYDA
ncbi:MAG: exopolyphosphatase [Desulfuromonadales bacterium]|nr:exopolyphosphatase [Desulfuromonadales bacterium]